MKIQSYSPEHVVTSFSHFLFDFGFVHLLLLLVLLHSWLVVVYHNQMHYHQYHHYNFEFQCENLLLVQNHYYRRCWFCVYNLNHSIQTPNSNKNIKNQTKWKFENKKQRTDKLSAKIVVCVLCVRKQWKPNMNRVIQISKQKNHTWE